MATSHHLTKIAIVGAGGNSGRLMTEALLANGKHTITAITRVDSQAKLPEGVSVKKVDYARPETLVDALKDQEALVISLSGRAPPETEHQLIKAAGEAGVSWILPNEWSPDTANEALVKDVPFFAPKDITNRTVTIYDEGRTKVSTSTQQQVARAVTALLSLPIEPDNSQSEACLSKLANKVVYIKSFTIDQHEMLESVLRVTGTKREDWTIANESAEERFTTGMKEVKEGKLSSFPKIMARLFYDDGCGDFEHGKGTLNDVLGLPEENIDEATKRAIEHSKASAH